MLAFADADAPTTKFTVITVIIQDGDGDDSALYCPDGAGVAIRIEVGNEHVGDKDGVGGHVPDKHDSTSVIASVGGVEHALDGGRDGQFADRVGSGVAR